MLERLRCNTKISTNVLDQQFKVMSQGWEVGTAAYGESAPGELIIGRGGVAASEERVSGD
jgi:hypothetical protein